MSNLETELAFVRELSVAGLVLAGEQLSAQDKCERIRVAILAQRLEKKEFAPGETYAQAFRRCFGKPIERRRIERDEHGRPIGYIPPSEDAGP